MILLLLLGCAIPGLIFIQASSDDTFREEYTDFATQLREDLLSKYDKVVPPRSKRPDNFKSGTDVDLQIRFFKVQSVDASSGLMNLKVWVRMWWSDLRLRWNPANYGNITQVHFLAAHWTAAEVTEIWLPDLQLYNSDEGTVFTLEPAGAIVMSDGSVAWSRPGMIKTMCKFSGLVAFPYDRMRCAMEWGGWSFSGGFQGIALRGKGYAFSNQETSAGSSYQEYSIQEVSCEVYGAVYAEVSSDVEPWPVAKYVITLNRASFYYSLLIIAPTILMTMLSFGVFFMSPEVGERLSFGITLVLVVEVSKVTVATFVPQCGELLWVDLLMWICTLFCLASLLETMVVLFLAFHADEHLLPTWLSWLRPSFYTHQTEESKDDVSCAGQVFKELPHYPEWHPSSFDSGRKPFEARGNDTDTARLIYFENLYYELDPDCNGSIGADEIAKFVSFVNLDMSKADCIRSLNMTCTAEKTNEDVQFGHLSRYNFVSFCARVLWNIPLDEIKVGAQTYTIVRNKRHTLLTSQWMEMSRTVDQWARFWMPFLFIVSLGVMANLKFDDNYMDKDAVMFEGFGTVSITGVGLVQACIAPVLGFMCFLTWLRLHISSLQKKAELTSQKTKRTLGMAFRRQTAEFRRSSAAYC